MGTARIPSASDTFRGVELPVAELSYGDPDSENLLIQGDNLDALKALLPYYAGCLTCIAIDPPSKQFKA